MSQTHTFASRLTALRSAQGLTRNALAVRAGVSPILLNRYEAGGRTPTLAVATRIARALGVSLAEFDSVKWPEKKGEK